MIFRVAFVTLLSFPFLLAFGAAETPRTVQASAEDRWADSVYHLLTDDERIGQLIMARAHSDRGPDHVAEVERLVRDYHVGGLCFFQGTPEKQAELTNRYQMLSPKVQLMVAMDAEWGLNMRLKDAVMAFPRQLMLGAIREDSLIYEMGLEIARQCRRLGVHVNFAPVADVNINPNNPVINDRAFGEDKVNVTAKCFAYMKGLQDGNVMACAKHFPGHGDTNVDSHYELPMVYHSAEMLDTLDLFPFRVLSQHGIMSMMVAHLSIPTLDNRANWPTSMSDKVIHDLLVENIGFEGLIFTDGMEMKGLTNHFQNGDATAQAIAVGNDVALLPQNVPDGIAAIKRFLADGRLTPARVEEGVRKVLRAKYRLGLSGNYTHINSFAIRDDLNSYAARDLKRRLTENALTLVRNSEGALPVRDVANQSVVSVSLGTGARTTFQQYCQRYAGMPVFSFGNNITEADKARVLKAAEGKVLLISLHDMKSKADQGFGISKSQIDFINEMSGKAKVALVVFGNPYALKYFDQVNNVVVAYNDDPVTQEIAAQAVFGAIGFKGKLPVTASARSRAGMGDLTDNNGRIRYETPERVGMKTDVLNRIDYLAQEAISSRATPGCQVLAMKDGAIVFHKSYGTLTYDAGSPPVTNDHIFDLASITKICATTLSVMKLVEEGKVDLDAYLSEYVPYLKGTNKENLHIRDIMAHMAGLQPWIPFYQNTMYNDGRQKTPSPSLYSNVANNQFGVPVIDGLYLRNDYPDSLRHIIAKSPLRENKNYKYSDLGFIMLADLVKNVSGLTIDEYAKVNFYEPLGMGSTTFNPWKTLPDSVFVPTEDDNYFRMKPVKGYVHDMGAAMLGGVSGHAGLFSNCSDLAILSQMLLNGGEYAGIRYLKPETIATFTSRYHRSTRRGIGFDMRDLGGNSDYISARASSRTYGHTGFTGNGIWIDPETNIVFIFLSNRTYPTMNNNKLISGDFRPRAQTIVYDSRM